MITCNNCNNEPKENDKIVWECHSCGKNMVPYLEDIKSEMLRQEL